MKLIECTAAVAAIAAVMLLTAAPSWAKTAKECNAEYSANKAAIKAAQKKADFIAACKAGTETIPGGATAAPVAPAATPPIAAAPTSAPAPIPAAPTPMAPAATPKAPKAATKMTPMAPAATTAPTAANQFSTEAQAKGRCPGATVVWLNTKSGVYHFASTKNYGTTKAGAYMCETDATAAGDRASKDEKHP